MTRTVRIPQTASMKPTGASTATGSGASLQVFVCDDDLNQQLLMVLAAEECNYAIEYTFVDRGVDLLMVLHQRLEFGGLPDLIVLNLDKDGRSTLGQLQMHQTLWQIPVLALIPIGVQTPEPHSLTEAFWCEERPDSFDDLVALVDSLPARAAQSGLTIELNKLEADQPMIDLEMADVLVNLTNGSDDREIDLSELDL